MKPTDPHKQSQALRRFKPTRKPAGVFTIAIAFCDTCLLALGFFLAASPFVLQSGINVSLPLSPFSGGARFGSMVLSITQGGKYYFNDEPLDVERLRIALEKAAQRNPDAPLIIEADGKVMHETVVEAWNAALAAGIPQVTIATGIAAQQETSP